MAAVLVPFVFFVMQLSSLTYLYHSHPCLPWIGALLGIIYLFCFASPPPTDPKDIQPWHRKWVPVWAMLIALISGTAIGRVNYDVMLPWIQVTFFREYAGVHPDSDPAAFADAGVLHFAMGARVDGASSVGHRAFPRTYCAAPVVGERATEAPGFWAVGVDCCDGWGEFSCGDATVAGTRAGLRVASSAGAKEYRAAIRAAAAVYGLEVPEHPILVTWAAEPAQLGAWAWTSATIIFCIVFGIAVLVTGVVLGLAVLPQLMKKH